MRMLLRQLIEKQAVFIMMRSSVMLVLSIAKKIRLYNIYEGLIDQIMLKPNWDKVYSQVLVCIIIV